MNLPYPVDPSLPANVSPLFSDITAARGDHLRANNSQIWANLVALAAAFADYVLLTGNQAIAGIKTFLSGIVAPSIGTAGATDFTIKTNGVTRATFEDEGYFHTTYGRTPTAYIWGTKTSNEIFDALKNYIPDTNDIMIIHGSVGHPNSTAYIWIVSYAQRYNATQIYIYNVRFSSGSSTAVASRVRVEDGDTESYEVALSW